MTGILHSLIASYAGPYAAVGYFGGGLTSNTTAWTGMDSVPFATDTKSSLSITLDATGAESPGGAANSGVAGYTGGGAQWYQGGNPVAFSEKFLFPVTTKTKITNALSSARGYVGGLANSGTAAYWAGGGTSVSDVSTVDKTNFSADTRTTLGTGLSAARNSVKGASNNGVAGYFAGQTTVGDKFTFSTDTRSTLTALSNSRSNVGGFADSGVAGYFAGGGLSSTLYTTTDKVTFSTDTRTTLATGLGVTRSGPHACANSGDAGYVAAGGGTTTVYRNTMDKFLFPSDAKATITTTLSASAGYGMAFADAGVF